MRHFLAAAVAALSLVACSSFTTTPSAGGAVLITSIDGVKLPVPLPDQSAAQIAAEVCPAIKAFNAVITTPLVLPPAATLTADGVSAAANALCGIGAAITVPPTVSIAQLQQIQTEVVPALITTVKASSLPPQQQAEIIAGLGLAGVGVQTAMQVVQNVQAGTPTPTVSAGIGTVK